MRSFSFVGSSTMRVLLERYHRLDDWAAFASSSNTPGPDTPAAPRGILGQRQRGPIERGPQPHYQTLHYNPLQGDIEALVRAGATRNQSKPQPGCDSHVQPRLLRYARAIGGVLANRTAPVPNRGPRRRTRRATPEGVHRDGVDYVLVLLIARQTAGNWVSSP